MLKTLVFVGAIATAFASPALAEDVKVSLTGKSVDQVQSEIDLAARKVCRDASRESPFGYVGSRTCITRTIDAAKAQLAKQLALVD